MADSGKDVAEGDPRQPEGGNKIIQGIGGLRRRMVKKTINARRRDYIQAEKRAVLARLPAGRKNLS